MLAVFSDVSAGLVPATGGVTGAYLRSDGTWTADNLMLLDATQTIAGTKRFSGAGAFVLLGRAGDPAAPEAGQLWHDAAAGHIKARVAGETRVLDGQDAIPMLVPEAGQYAMTTVGVGGDAVGTVMGLTNRLDMYPFIPRADMPVAALAVNCTTAAAGALGKFVLYGSDDLGRPSALLIESATVDLSSTGVKDAALAGVNLRAGRTYWLGFRYFGTASISSWPMTATPDINGGAPSTAARKILRRTRSFATAAAANWAWNPAEITAAAAPAIWLKL